MRNVLDISCTQNSEHKFCIQRFPPPPKIVPFTTKCCTARNVTNDNIIQRMCFACWITKSRNTHPEYVTLIIFQDNNGYGNAAYIYVIHTLLVLSYSSDISKDTDL